MNRIIFWDFDGTLGYRIDGMWSAAMHEALRELHPECAHSASDMKLYVQTGFPWHTPHIPHTDIKDADSFWERLQPIFASGYADLGYDPGFCERCSQLVRHKYVHPDKWALFPDTREALQLLREDGWTHVIISNHVPELHSIAEHLGLMPLISAVINSAEVGYEKPHPEIFRIALARMGMPATTWMVGDNFEADVKGAERAGIPAILARKHHELAERRVETILEVAELVTR